MPIIEESQKISGVMLVQLKSFADSRGRFMETFRKEWFPQRSWQKMQTNRSDSQPNVLRGLHYHHKQVDYWYVAAGKLKAGLADLRPDSPTYQATQTVEMSAENNLGLFIPVGVAHGFVTLEKATLIYVVDNYYDGEDEFGIIWNDPDLNVDWGVTNPILSPRDENNPRLKEIPSDKRPQ
jgi:dTDP-4-dehydrorhamnose 3,5-epimerase